MLLLAGGFLWLAPVAVPEAARGEVVSWSAFGVAVIGWWLIYGEALRGWRLALATTGAAFLVLLLVILAQDVNAIRAAAEREARPVSYREARGVEACGTSACRGHEAGWAWAENEGLSDPEECGGKSRSFEEGCRAYAEEATAPE
jgi:hypothetical protein